MDRHHRRDRHPQRPPVVRGQQRLGAARRRYPRRVVGRWRVPVPRRVPRHPAGLVPPRPGVMATHPHARWRL